MVIIINQQTCLKTNAVWNKYDKVNGKQHIHSSLEVLLRLSSQLFLLFLQVCIFEMFFFSNFILK